MILNVRKTGHKPKLRWDPLGDSPELVLIHNPAINLDHTKRMIVAANFYEIPAEAVEQAARVHGGSS